ncbi:MAG TPA: hypothetical protein VN737_24280 [Bryobacteraceae bacterium]|nr:hypothetical protein [Bryobacteraceae bacterium]
MKAGNSSRPGKASGILNSGCTIPGVNLPNGCSNSGFALSSYGVRIAIETNEPGILKRIPEDLLPGATMAGSRKADVRFFISRDDEHAKGFALYEDRRPIAHARSLPQLLVTLEAAAQHAVARLCRKHVFIHAGVVRWKGRAIILPGRSFSGKSTLVLALVRVGATYYSDEFAVVDTKGRIHPFSRRPHVRTASGQKLRRKLQAASPDTGGKLPAVAECTVAVCKYKPCGRWKPRSMTKGETLLELMGNTVVARTRPEDSLKILAKLVRKSTAFKTVRGDVGESARALLMHVNSRTPGMKGTRL